MCSTHSTKTAILCGRKASDLTCTFRFEVTHKLQLLWIGIVDKALASHSWGQGLNPTESRGEGGGLMSPVIQVCGRPELDAGAEVLPLSLQDNAHTCQAAAHKCHLATTIWWQFQIGSVSRARPPRSCTRRAYRRAKNVCAKSVKRGNEKAKTQWNSRGGGGGGS